MAEKETLALSDGSVVPTDDIVFSLIGGRKRLWQRMLESLQESHEGVSWNWNYYNDGHRWLLKLVQKKRTILWGAILTTGEFRITFYFADKAEPLINESSLPQEVKESFRTARKYGAVRPASLLVNSEGDVDTVLKLAEIRTRLR